MNDGPARRGDSLRRTLYTAGKAVLLVWAVGLCVTAVQLGDWRQELTRTLLQLQADTQFRARVHQREAVDPEWYRRKALSLLSATERLRRDTTWTLFVPGSWHLADDLEERVQDRIGHEFGEIVVETIRRELYARASQLTGVPQARGSGDLQADADCQSPVPQNLDRNLTAAAEDLPEFVAAREYVIGVERLDAAVQAYLSLQYAGGQPEQLRRLVAYTLNTELPGDLARSAVMFHGPEEVNLQPALMQARLQWATRCALDKAMGQLHNRLLNTNELFALEQNLVQRSAGLFDPSARAMPFDRTLERYRAVHALLEDQHALLAKGRNDWMGQASLQLGPSYQEMLQRIEHTRLLGPAAVQQLQNQSGAAFAEFRRQFQSAFGSSGEPGIVWLEGEKRFGLSAERAGLRQGLDELLKTPFMNEPAAQGESRSRAVKSLAVATEQARGLADARLRFFSNHLASFPDDAQAVVSRVVDTRVSDLIYQRAQQTLKAALPADTSTPLEPAIFREQRQQVQQLQALLRETGSTGLGDRLVAMLDGEVLRRLARIQNDWREQPLHDARASDFGWWQGEPMAVPQVVGAADGATTLAKLATRLELLTQQAKAMIALGSPALQTDPAALRWLQLQSELERYRARDADSSLLKLERYASGLGVDLRRENCAERLAANLPAAGPVDDIGQRHVQIHNALASRCNELRARAPASAAVVPPAPATASP